MLVCLVVITPIQVYTGVSRIAAIPNHSHSHSQSSTPLQQPSAHSQASKAIRSSFRSHPQHPASHSHSQQIIHIPQPSAGIPQPPASPSTIRHSHRHPTAICKPINHLPIPQASYSHPQAILQSINLLYTASLYPLIHNKSFITGHHNHPITAINRGHHHGHQPDSCLR